jgi:hypothetical protein
MILRFYLQQNLTIGYGSICNLINMLITIDQESSSNFAHPAIIELCKKFYYGGKSDSLATLFPEEFKILPRGSRAMACTCVRSLFIAITLLVIIIDHQLLARNGNGVEN